MQVKAEYAAKTLVFWCLFFDGEKDAVVVPFLDRKRSIPDVIAEIKLKRGRECILIDSETIVDYVVEVMNYELARAGEAGLLENDWEAGLLVNDWDLDSRTWRVLDWPTPLLDSEKEEVEACLRTLKTNSMQAHPDTDYGLMQVHPDTDYSLRVEACMLEHDALVWREFRIFTEDHLSGLYDKYNKGQVLLGKREPEVLLVGLPNNCRAQPGASLGFPTERFATDPEGWELVPTTDVSSILSDVERRITPVLDRTQLRRFRRQRLKFYDDLALLEIITEPASSDERSIAYILLKPGFALPLDSTSTPIHQVNERVAAERHGPVIRDKEQAAAYVIFFCRHVWADEEPFIVLKSKDDNAVRELTDVKAIADQLKSKDAGLARIVEPVGREVKSSGNQRAFEVDAWVLWGLDIYFVIFGVLADGSIEMTEKTEDEPIFVSARVQGDGYLPYRKLESVISEPAISITASKLASELALESKLAKESGQWTVLTGQLTGETLPVRTFHRCRFRGRVNLRLLVSDRGLSFEECVFENGLDLSGASLKGKLSIKDCLLVQRQHNELIDVAKAFSCDDLSANGLHIDGLWSNGSFSAKGVRIHGAVQLSKMMTLGGIDFGQSVIEQCLDFQDVRTGKNVDVKTSIRLYGAVIKYNYVAFRGVTLTGDLSANFLRVGTGFFLESDAARGNTIGGSIELGAANLAKLLRIRNTRVGKSIEAKGVATAEVRILGGHLQSERPEAAAEEFRTSHIGGFIDLTDANIKHDVTLVDLEVGSSRREVTGSDASLRLRNAKVGGNVRLFLEAKDAKAQGWLYAGANAGPDFAGKWRRGLDLKNAAILGDVDLSGVQCRAGGISLEEAEIQRDLHIRKRGSGHRAAATHLAMAGLKCQGAADITGLKLSAYPRPAAGRLDGAVIADRATFANKLIVADVGRFATIPGRLDLAGSTIGELAVSYNSFPLDVDEEKEVDDKNLTAEDKKELDDKNLKTHGIILNRARVDRLSVFRTSSDNEMECRYPQPIDLGFAEIKWWAFRQGEESESDKARDYKQILLGDHNKQRHTFSSIEQNLFNRGLDVEADDIHKAMRDWLQTQGNDTFFGRWKNRGRFLWDSVTRATTSPWRLLSVVVLSTLFSALCVFANPANIGPSEAGLTAHPKWRADSSPPDAEWDRWSGFWMAVRFHVPVAVLTARSAWAPANGRELTVSLPYLSWRTARLSPEDYANIVLALHCLIWPVILIIASRKFFMRLGK